MSKPNTFTNIATVKQVLSNWIVQFHAVCSVLFSATNNHLRMYFLIAQQLTVVERNQLKRAGNIQRNLKAEYSHIETKNLVFGLASLRVRHLRYIIYTR